MILLACAVEEEIAFWQPRAGVETLVMGVGPVEAASAIAAALAARRYGLVVNAGLGGAFDGAAQIGDGVVVAEDAMEYRSKTARPEPAARRTDRRRGALGAVARCGPTGKGFLCCAASPSPA